MTAASSHERAGAATRASATAARAGATTVSRPCCIPSARSRRRCTGGAGRPCCCGDASVLLRADVWLPRLGWRRQSERGRAPHVADAHAEAVEHGQLAPTTRGTTSPRRRLRPPPARSRHRSSSSTAAPAPCRVHSARSSRRGRRGRPTRSAPSRCSMLQVINTGTDTVRRRTSPTAGRAARLQRRVAGLGQPRLRDRSPAPNAHAGRRARRCG